MRKLRKAVLAGVTATGLAMTLSACGDNVVGGDGPRPGVAFEVEGTRVSLDDLGNLTAGYCTLTEQDPQLGATSRSFAQRVLLERWLDAVIVGELAEREGIEAPEPRTPLQNITGWSELSDDEQAAVEDYISAVNRAQAVRDASEGEQPDAAGLDIAVNPRFDAVPQLTDAPDEHFALAPAGGRLSFGVSDLASSGAVEEPSIDEVSRLPESELCGERPDPQQPQVPLG
ncbi:hypothetical protein [Nocardioides sp. TF02-7]|uniref:hypothetical protein n=1 Tax=Nocardioides sp. TF02-7 TaxID=2917724 RepID=UPI001F06180D|nr:hypothetical protein [Nocardioides sp. TF02-7]UMG91554.1 hypothetical protein MF408_15760 [Nocardioides sp. TF02-7]